MQIIPVLIIGAGPTGLSMAIELERHGIPFRIIDQQIKPVGTSNALGVQTRTLEVWDDMGFLPTALSRGNIIRGINFSFEKKKHIHIGFSVVDSLYPFVLGLSQQQTEMIMLEYLKQKNITVEMPVEIVDLYEQKDDVIATLRDAKGSLEKLQANWLIACDGGRSFVRSKLNVSFPGKDLQEHFVIADVKLDSTLSKHEIYGFLSAQGPFMLIQYNKEYTRIIAEVTHDAELKMAKSLTMEQIKTLIAKRSPVPLKVTEEPLWTSGFWVHERIASLYRVNKVFFAGDAAHTHSPAGGQGMNTGIQDAYNLAWKLALVINKKGTPDMLATYQAERYGVAKSVLKNSTRLTHMVSIRNVFLRSIRNFIFSWLLKSSKIRKKFAEQITELGITYTSNLLVLDCLKKSAGPKAGMRMLDVRLGENERLMDVVRGSEFCLLLFSGLNPQPDINKLLEFNNKITTQYPGLIKTVLIVGQEGFDNWQDKKLIDSNKLIHSCYRVSEPSLYLIRPDKYIGFRGTFEASEELLSYLTKIFLG